MQKLAFRIKELAEAGPVKSTFIYDAIATGKLTARKAGAATVVLASDWEAFLTSLPKARSDARAS
ncbi:hypothetical protein [Bosea sp. AS-1]|uniref:hypothetical protein n=1 Tax=Bosea sp. AS-1 TaxID=2015316 RepID=UPI000B7848B2|nr:hypothetical protein [Bosea sp. AS-1]